MSLPKGFLASAVACGLKKSGKQDLALIFSEAPASAAAVFTTNQVKAAPVIVSIKHIRRGLAQAIVANAGNANCWTGAKGLRDAYEMASLAAAQLGIEPEKVLVTSTGTIGNPLAMNKVCSGIKAASLKLAKSGLRDAARAIMTTDLVEKVVSVKVGKYTVTGLAKGSGMIAPAMATMHAFILTDAAVDRKILQQVVRQASEKSFNMVSVDNCMSTNDCVFLLANGVSGVKVKKGEIKKFAKAVEKVCVQLAKEIARDGEGATKLVEIRAKGARNSAEAKIAVKALINSFLLKAAIYGKDRNFGRILQALGATRLNINWEKFKWSWEMKPKQDVITIDLKAGTADAVGWGCDLTEDYVKINADYHT
ncbi:MAG: bifunctional glutamate N-acetyltransferase/amino-acid acetyltransferase ArgJ [Candidatus Margulisbacteria bacterium]|nr:bifunctional glutamate N-acetyltransferase/amino-acid acetyltransferase ArgJ [Candidatus Margulisiibacteriota bacterium]MBU1617261.1 bifunctional glutamate N-acetyltransferase/amino-acid acetyltransferase ArgJ [Candidatus Margulisiibacteriota bacterium]